MKHQYLVILVIFVLGCNTQTQETKSEQSTMDSLSSVQPLELDSTPQTSSEEDVKPLIIPQDNVSLNDSSQILIVSVNNFVPTSEAYVFLNFNEGYSYDSIKMIKSHLDSVVFQDTETRRQRLPMDKAKVFFDLALLDSISIFNYSHKLKAIAQLKRVEYLNANIIGGFIAVFDTPDLEEWKLYGIGGTSDFIEEFKSEYFEDKTLDQAIKKMVNPGNLRVYDVTHVNLSSHGKFISAYSCGDYGENHKSYLIEEIGDQLKVLFELDDNYSIWNIIPVPVQVNGYPLLLVRFGKPETDFIWYSPVVFDGERYQLANKRVNLSDFSSNHKGVSDDEDHSLVSNTVSHSFSNTSSKDIFSISIVGSSIINGKAIFKIEDSDGVTIYSEEYPSSYLIGYGLVGDTITDEQKKNYIIKRVNEFFDEKNFSDPAIGESEVIDSDYSEEDTWSDIKSDPTAIGFYYRVGEESGCRIAYSKKRKKTVKYFCCC